MIGGKTRPASPLPTKLWEWVVLALSIGLIVSIVHSFVAANHSHHAPPPKGHLQRDQRCNLLCSKGQKYLRMGQLGKAEAAFRQALSLNKVLQPLAYRGLAQTLREEGRTGEALAAYGQAYTPATLQASTFPSQQSELLHYAQLCDKAGQWGQAVTVYGWAVQNTVPPPGGPPLSVRFDPHLRQSALMEAMIHVMQGIALSRQSKTYEALTAFNQAALLAPNSALVQYYRRYGLQRQHHLPQAQTAI